MASNFLNITNAPLGLRNNNPGNIRPIGKTSLWLGQIGKRGGFAMFKDVSYGIRAMAKNAMTQINKYGKNTVKKYITAYAPPAENDTAKYINEVAKALNIKPNDPIPLNYETIKKLIRIQMQTEIGKSHLLITDDDINRGLIRLNEK